jgi:HK97 family phage major capsid protein
MGIVTAATLGATFVGSFANDGVGGANTLGTDDLVALEHSLDPAYRQGAKFMMHDQTLASLKKLKDKFGHPIFMESTRDGQPSTISGYEYLLNQDMTPIQTQASSPPVTAKTVLFGQMPKFVIRKVRDMSVMVLRERFADFGQVGVLGFMRMDSQLLDAGTHPIVYGRNVY